MTVSQLAPNIRLMPGCSELPESPSRIHASSGTPDSRLLSQPLLRPRRVGVDSPFDLRQTLLVTMHHAQDRNHSTNHNRHNWYQ